MSNVADFEGHRWNWDASSKSLTIKPNRRNMRGAKTPLFGLGNATILLSLNNLPSKLTVPITDDTTGQGIVPTSPFKLRRWYSMPENLSEVSKTLTGYNNWQGQAIFKQATGNSVKETAPVPIKQNGYGCEEIVGDAPRLNW